MASRPAAAVAALGSRAEAQLGASPRVMASGRRTARGRRSLAAVALLGALCPVPAGAASSFAALQGASQSAASSGTAARAAAIPEWRLDAALMPTKSLETLAIAHDHDHDKERLALGRPAKEQNCPMVRFTKKLVSEPSYATWLGQTGTWRDEFSGVILSSWGQSFFAQDWQTMNFRDLDGRGAFTARTAAADELQKRFGWQVGLGPENYSAIVGLERPWKQAAHLTKVWDMQEGLVSVPRDKVRGDAWTKKEPPLMVALLGCEGELLFVIQLQASKRYPGTIDVYDPKGVLVAHSLTDTTVARHQFVDVDGRLLAIAEAPGLYQNISFVDLPRDPAMGDVFAYELKFELGGYTGASRLLEPDRRWILAAAVQLRAVADGRVAAPPALPEILPALYWITTFSFILLVALVCVCVTDVHPTKMPEYVTARLQAQAEAAKRKADTHVAWMQQEAQEAWTQAQYHADVDWLVPSAKVL